MTWRAVVAALDDGDAFRSRVSVYLHPLAGRPILWHVLHALAETKPPPSAVDVLHRTRTVMSLPDPAPVAVRPVPVAEDDTSRALRAGVTPAGVTVLVDGTAPLLTPATIARILRAADGQVAAILPASDESTSLLVAGEGPALASADDPRNPVGAVRIAPTSAEELIRITDRHSLSDASVAFHDRLIRQHEARGVTFILPSTTWLDADVRIGPDTVIYPGAVIEGSSEIGSECVIGPHTRIVESQIGRGVEMKGWNYVARTNIRNHAVLEPYVRRGFD
ncbi:MAG TPA: hypothetical protein VFK13_15050 [Gemmatimonadaceae bacterium]|nr:hypothetical protein [Gemmatimonadaceae bacterium]